MHIRVSLEKADLLWHLPRVVINISCLPISQCDSDFEHPDKIVLE